MAACELDHLPMSQLEQMLKKCFLQRPEIQKKILQPEELAAYISWMIENFAGNPEYRISEDVIGSATGAQMADLGNRILQNPRDSGAVSMLRAGYETQKEDRYIIAKHDISVGRMLRYMPSHWHSNDYFEVYYAFSGDCPIVFQDETVTVRPGTVLIVPPGVIHASPCYQDDRVLLYYMVRASTFDQVFWSQLPAENLMSAFFRKSLGDSRQTGYLQFESGSDPVIRELLFQLYREFRGTAAYRAQLMNSLMTTFFILLLRRYEGTARLPRTEDFFWKHEYSAILSTIQSGFAEVSMQSLVEQYHYSEHQITRIVRRCTGLSYAQLVLKLRMEHAAAMLQRGEGSIDYIAQSVGYSTTSSFYRAFVSYFSCTPAEYRKNNGT